MLFIWIMWAIVTLAIIATVILLTGKGSMLVSGFNTIVSIVFRKFNFCRSAAVS